MVEICKRNHISCWTLELEWQTTSKWHYFYSLRYKSKQYMFWYLGLRRGYSLKRMYICTRTYSNGSGDGDRKTQVVY